MNITVSRQAATTGDKAKNWNKTGLACGVSDDPQTLWKNSVEKVDPGLATIYIHFPFCRSRCVFCPFYFGMTDLGGAKEYVRLLKKEIAETAVTGLSQVPVNAVYFGGGTPTDMDAGDLAALLSLVRKSYNLTNDCEITIEGRVSGFSEDKMQACVDHGANRFSIGVQTFDTKLRQSLGRKADKKTVISTLEKLISFNQAAVVLDLLYGLPGQTMDSWLEDQRIVLEDVPVSGLDHYLLTVHPELPLEKALAGHNLPRCPDEEQAYEMYRVGEEIMRDCGAARISIKHYALSYRERNANNDISGLKKICIPFGMHAGGRINACRFRQTDDPGFYQTMVEQGCKPLNQAGIMLPGHQLCGVLRYQISRLRGINMQLALREDAAMAELVTEHCKPLLDSWLEQGLLYPARMNWLRLSSRAMFMHKKLVPKLMEKIMAAYNNNVQVS